MTDMNAAKRLARRLQVATDRPYAACLEQVRDWDDNLYADSANQVILAEVRHSALTASGGDIPVEVAHLGHGTDGVEIQAPSGEALRVWDLDGVWGFTWMADDHNGHILCVGNFLDATGKPLATAALTTADDAARRLLDETIQWLAIRFATAPGDLPTGDLPAGLEAVIDERPQAG